MYADPAFLREKKDALTVPLESVTRDGEDATVLPSTRKTSSKNAT